MQDLNELYTRQKPLKLDIPTSITILGIGGIGSWLALDLALVGVRRLILIDPDHVELNNLNRTPFTLAAAKYNVTKVAAITEEILVRRSTDIIPIPKHTDDLTLDEVRLIKESDLIIDTRDRIDPVPFRIDIKLGYDGKNMTLIFNPDYQSIYQEGGGYEIIPSYLVPPQLLAALITDILVSGKIKELRKRKEMYIVRLTTDEVVSCVLQKTT